ncbi:HEAT repeat domain-containing protein [Ktedonobacter robiniae]|uniref:HEAT repeat domain-containing protein n=1 Tax=Ktedonobacter robiniae TaxID=2778365 RepID=A0ABQ3V6I3_9CHLR|nr:HEAT repeat domain-containing protein [Ktedonobacter robiniae]GHO60474.1 hypothetical protein KSB_89490 [Ktedonobacter robiniae]
MRIIVATHPAPAKKKKKRQVGRIRNGVVYELFLTNLPQSAFTASDVVSLYLHRGAFETALEDEDQEQEPDRWCSHSAWGQEAWQCISQWTWNVRLESGHILVPEPLRTTEFAPAIPPQPELAPTPPSSPPASAPASGYAPPATATSWKAGRFTGADFPLQPDGTLRCPAGNVLVPYEHRRERDAKWRVRGSAAISLGKLGDVRAVEPLLTALSDADADVRRLAAEALEKLGGMRALPPLRARLSDPRPDVI